MSSSSFRRLVFLTTWNTEWESGDDLVQEGCHCREIKAKNMVDCLRVSSTVFVHTRQHIFLAYWS